jgi:serine/threonine protein kinase
VGGQAAEQIIAGVVLSERLAVTMYGAIHRAQFGGQRNLRGLVVDPKMLAEDAFRIPLTDSKNIAAVTALNHANIEPTVGVESGGPDVVVVTRGAGRFVTVQDLITAAKAKSKGGGKLSMPVAALIGKCVIEALAVAHKAGVIHGAVHPRSVLIDEEGAVRLSDFVVGRALTTAVAQGAESSLWRGLTGYIAPELVVGEDPTPGADVFAVGAMLFTMLSGEVPPGSLHATPAVERLVQRALDTDVSRRYKTATDLLENLLEAMEDDRWALADRGELIEEAGLSQTDTGNIDEATEDLLASLNTPTGVQLAPMRPSADLRASEVAKKAGKNDTGGRLDALLANLGDDATGMTTIDEPPSKFARDPISDIIRKDPRRGEAIVSTSRVPSLDDPDDDEPLPRAKSHPDLTGVDSPGGNKRRASSAPIGRSNTDEAAAMDAIGELDHGARRVSTAGEQAAAAAAKLEEAAHRAERAAKRLETNTPMPMRAQAIQMPTDLDVPPPRLKSRVPGIIGAIVIVGGIAAGIYFYKNKMDHDEAEAAAHKKDQDDRDKAAKALEDKLRSGQPDPGTIEVNSMEAGIWLRLGRTPLDTSIWLPASQAHDLVLIKDGDEPTEAQVNATSWSGTGKELKAKVSVPLKPLKPKAKPPEIPLQPTSQVLPTTGIGGQGPVHIESTPSDAEVWLFLGANNAKFSNVWAGRDYELAVVRPGYKTQHVTFKAEDWRDGGDPNIPIDAAKKKLVLHKDVELEKAK